MNKFMKITSVIFALFLIMSVSVTAFATAEDTTPDSDGLIVNDMADILTDDEEIEISNSLYDTMEKYGMTIVLVTTDSTGEKTPEQYADDYYDYNDYYDDGAVLMVSMSDRKWHFSTKGKAIDAFTDNTIEYIFDENVVEYFKDDDWYGGFSCYAQMADQCLNAYSNGEEYPPVSAFDVWKRRAIYFAVCLVIAFIITLIVMLSVKSKYKNVRFNSGADDYMVNGSFRLKDSYDAFLYSTVTRAPKPKENNSSSTHTSSSGSTHGGGGGSF